MELTKKTIGALKLPEGKTEIEFWDDKLKGFGARVRPGSINFFYYYRINGNKRRMTLGLLRSRPLMRCGIRSAS